MTKAVEISLLLKHSLSHLFKLSVCWPRCKAGGGGGGGGGCPSYSCCVNGSVICAGNGSCRCHKVLLLTLLLILLFFVIGLIVMIVIVVNLMTIMFIKVLFSLLL